jgi:hypothetical protein
MSRNPERLLGEALRNTMVKNVYLAGIRTHWRERIDMKYVISITSPSHINLGNFALNKAKQRMQWYNEIT